LRFTYGDVDFIVGGDCELAGEASILTAFPSGSLEVEYFKASHHGINDANSAAYVSALRPRVVFVPNTRAVWDPPEDFENIGGRVGSTLAGFRHAGIHTYIVDEATTLDRHWSSGRQYNVTFATDGLSYEIRVEQATQPTPSLTAQQSGCFDHARGAHEHVPVAAGF
jgi:hypothetical protein